MLPKLNKEDYARFGLEFLAKEESYADCYFERFIIPELRQLQSAADAEGISILFFKGYIEKYDTYKPLHLNREQCDVDLLVALEDVWALCRICSSFGYVSSSGALTEEWVNASVSDLNRHHLPVIHKSLLNDALAIHIEIHVALTPQWNRMDDRSAYVRSILRHKCVPNEALGLYGMCLSDRLIFSFLYFTNDFLADLSTFYYCPDNLLFHCKTLADAYLIYKKYARSIDVSRVMERIHEFGLEYCALFSVRILQNLFDSEALNEVLAQLPDASIDEARANGLSFIDKILYSAYLSAQKMAESGNVPFYKQVIANCLSMNETLRALKGKRAYFHLKGLDGAPAYFIWDDSGITLSIEIPKKELQYWREDIRCYDGLNLRIYNPDYDVRLDNAVRNIFVCFRQSEQQETSADVTFNGSDPALRGTEPAKDIKAALLRSGKAHQVLVTVPWSVQNLNPSACAYIGFECTLCLYDGTVPTLFYWSNGAGLHHNPAKFGRVSLVNA